MIDLGIAAVGGFFYLTGQYTAALLLIVLAIISGAGAALLAIVNPDWYFEKRTHAGLDVDIFNPRKGIASLLVTKLVIIAGLSWGAWHIAEKAGYL
jgi:hypothetical protein